ncbi:MAG: type VI secretion system baseplate subunit TssG [Planctomycetota bacterium]
MTALLQRLGDRAPEFEFRQLVRLLHLAARDAGRGAPALGAVDLADEVARFQGNVSFQFAASDVQAAEPPSGPEAGRRPWRVAVNFMGLANPGVQGSLPSWYANLIVEEQRAANKLAPERRRQPLRDFVDLFNHRFLSLWFRAWLKHNLPVQLELDRRGPVRRALLSLVGLGTAGLQEQLRIDPNVLLGNAAVFTRRPATAAGLRAVLEGHFGVAVAVEPFVVSSQPLDRAEQLALDGRRQLGLDTLLGESAQLTQGKFRLRLGPLGWDRFADFLPGSAGMGELQQVVRTLVGMEFDYDVRLVLAEHDVPTLGLGDEFADRARLGWSTWLGTRLHGGDVADTLCPASDLELSPQSALA